MHAAIAYAMANDRATVVFWRAPADQQLYISSRDFNGRLRIVVCDLAVVRPRRGSNKGNSGTNLYTMRVCCLIVRRPLKARASRRWRALTGRQTRGHTAHRARHHRKEEHV